MLSLKTKVKFYLKEQTKKNCDKSLMELDLPQSKKKIYGV